jgi:hypothetical protein
MADLDRELRSLAHMIDWPDIDVAASTAAELRAGRTADRPLPRLSLWPRRKVIALVVAALLLIGGTAFAARLAIGSITIHTAPKLSSPTSSAPPRSILGHAASLEAVAPLVRVSADTSLGAPDGMFLARSPAGPMASLTWNAPVGAPHLDATGWRAILMAFEGTDTVAATKQVSPRTTLVPVHVAGFPGYWIEGPHQLVLPDGGTLRLGGGVLIWTRNGVTFRLESTLSRADALAVGSTIG